MSSRAKLSDRVVFVVWHDRVQLERQAAAQGQLAAAACPQSPATDTVAPGHPGRRQGRHESREVVKRRDFRATDGPVPLPDGSIIFWNFPTRPL